MFFLPFRPLLADPERAADIAAPPYDVVTRQEARHLAADRPLSFLHISRPDLEFPDTVGPHEPEVYARGAQRLREFIAQGWLQHDCEEAFFLYRMETANGVQWGWVGVCDTRDYERGHIRRHERTRTDAEDDRTRHLATLGAHTEPVWLFWDDREGWAAEFDRWAVERPLYDLTRPDGVRHTLWRITVGKEAIIAHFAATDRCYIADGHHRAAAAARLAAQRRAETRSPVEPASYNHFLALICPAEQLRIQPYNRMIRDLGRHTPETFLAAVARTFVVRPAFSPHPAAPGRVHLYLRGKWLELSWPPLAEADPVAALDVSILQERLFGPILGIVDPRTDPRLIFKGGVESAEALAAAVDRGEGAAAFSLHPITVRQLMAVADAGQVMPPKSTWFAPKPLSGLVIHPLDSATAQ